jgi:tetratricopeptide (TPR) repeat protein
MLPAVAMWRARALSILVVLTLAGILYGNAVGNQFTLDDHSYLENNPSIRSCAGVGYLFAHPLEAGQTLRGHLYRPFAALVELVIGCLAGYGPAPFHLANIVLHALNGFLLLCLLGRWLDPRQTWIAVIVFLCHPVQTEVVASAVGITELLAFQLGVAAIFLAVRRDTSWWRDLLAAVCFLLALLSKETSASYLALAVLAAILVGVERRRWLELGLVFSVPMLIYASLRFHVIGSLLRSPLVDFAFLDNPLDEASVANRTVNALVILVRYLGLLAWPVPLSADYSYNAIPLVATHSLMGLAAIVFHLSLIAVSWLARRRLPLVSCSILVFYIAILPASNLLFPGGTIMGERFLYLPVVAFGLVIAWLWQQMTRALPGRRPWQTVIVAALVVAFAARTVLRNRDWSDDYRLFSRVVAVYPNNAKAHYNLAVLDYDRQSLATSLEHAQRAVSIYPRYLDARLLLARLHTHQGRPDLAEEVLTTSLELGIEHESSYLELGNLYIESGRLERAIPLLERGMARIPLSMSIPYNLAMIYMESERYEDAERCLRAALANGDLPGAHYALGTVALVRNDLATARREMQAARKSLELRRQAVTLEAYCMVLAADPAEARQLLLSELGDRDLEADQQLVLAAATARAGDHEGGRRIFDPLYQQIGGQCSSLGFAQLCQELADELQ